jgi:hypothetical protein
MAASIEIPGVDFGAIAREVVAIKLTESLATSPDGIKAIVLAALGQKVKADNGQEPRSYDTNTVSWVEYVAADMIRSATKEVLADQVEKMRPRLVKAVEEALKKNTTTIAASLVDTYANEAKNGYRLFVSMQFAKHER